MKHWEEASHNKRVSNVPHTIFLCCRPPKSTSCVWVGLRGREWKGKKTYFIDDRRKNKKISFLLRSTFCSPPPPPSFSVASASIISFDFTAKKRRQKRHQNEIFYVEDILWFNDATQACLRRQMSSSWTPRSARLNDDMKKFYGTSEVELIFMLF